MGNYEIEQSEDFYEGKCSEYVPSRFGRVDIPAHYVDVYCGIWGPDFEGEEYQSSYFESLDKMINKIINEFNVAYYKQCSPGSSLLTAVVESTGKFSEALRNHSNRLSGARETAIDELFNIVNAKVFNDCPVVEEIPRCEAIRIGLLATHDSCTINNFYAGRERNNEIELELGYTLYVSGEGKSKKFENIVWFRKIARELKSLIFNGKGEAKPNPQKLRTWVLQHLKIDSKQSGVSKVRPKELFKRTAKVSRETAQQILIDLARVFGIEDSEISAISITWEKCVYLSIEN